jgi:hypothetical protein
MATIYVDSRFNPPHRFARFSFVVLSAVMTFLAALLIAARISHGA